MTNFVVVEISVFKPQGYSITYMVKGTSDRWAAVKRASEEMEKQQSGCMAYVNYIACNTRSVEGRNVVEIEVSE